MDSNTREVHIQCRIPTKIPRFRQDRINTYIIHDSNTKIPPLLKSVKHLFAQIPTIYKQKGTICNPYK